MAATGQKHQQFKSLARVSPTYQIREQLLDAIESGVYGPGELLPSERALCESFGVSRVSVREAIAGLEAMGVVKVRHGIGCQVAEDITDRYSGTFGDTLRAHHDQMIDMLNVRGALEELSAYECAKHSPVDVVDDLKQNLDEFAAVIRERQTVSVDELVALDVRFHATIARGSGSILLAALLEELNTHITDSRRYTFLGEGQAERSLRDHQKIVDAIERGEPDLAKRRSGAHMAGVRKRLSDRVQAS